MTSFKDNNITDVEMSLKIRLFIVTQQVTALGWELLRGMGNGRKQADTGPEKMNWEQSGILSPQSDLSPTPGLLGHPALLWACGGHDFSQRGPYCLARHPSSRYRQVTGTGIFLLMDGPPQNP